MFYLTNGLYSKSEIKEGKAFVMTQKGWKTLDYELNDSLIFQSYELALEMKKNLEKVYSDVNIWINKI